MLDAFHVVKLATQVVDDVRRRVQQDTTGHRGRKNDPLYRIRNILRAGEEHLTDRQRARLARRVHRRRDDTSRSRLAWRCAQQVRSAYHQDTPAAGRRVAEKIVATFATCPIPEVARLGTTLRRVARARSWATSTPAARATAAPKPSTASSSSTAASPEASATETTTASGCSSSAAAYRPSPTLIREEPLFATLGWSRSGAAMLGFIAPKLPRPVSEDMSLTLRSPSMHIRIGRGIRN